MLKVARVKDELNCLREISISEERAMEARVLAVSDHALDVSWETESRKHNRPEFGKSSPSLSSELMRTFVSALRVPERHCRISEDMLKKKIRTRKM